MRSSNNNNHDSMLHDSKPKISKKYRALFLFVAASVALPLLELPVARQCVTRGDAFFTADMFHQAARQYRKALILSPRFTDAYNRLAVTHDKLGDTDKAISTYLRSLEKDPGNDVGYVELGRLHLLRKKKYGEAEQYFRKALAINPGSKEAYVWLAILYGISGDRDKAISICRDMLERFPGDPWARKKLKKLVER